MLLAVIDCDIYKIADFGVLAKFVITRICGQLSKRVFAPKCSPVIALYAHTN